MGFHRYRYGYSQKYPQVTMMFTSHNGITLCHMCNINSLCVPDSCTTTHYIPLDRSHHLNVKDDPTTIKKYNTHSLPLQTHLEIMAQGREVDMANTTADANRLSTKYGVKGVPLLSHLSSLTFPTSFPFDFMHLIYKNLLKNLIQLWTGQFKGLDEGDGSYEFNPKVWEAIGTATAAPREGPRVHTDSRREDAGLRAQMGQAGRGIVADEFSFARRMHKIRGIYDRILGRGESLCCSQ